MQKAYVHSQRIGDTSSRVRYAIECFGMGEYFGCYA